jgi:hypothetical protein
MTRHSTPPRVIVETDAVSLRYHVGAKIVHHELRRFVHGEELRSVLEKGLELIITHRACKWLSDDRGNAPLTPQDAEWAEREWAPRVVAAGWKYWAVVMPQKITGQMYMRRRIAKYEERGLIVRTFEDPDDALVWLERQKA